VAGWGDGTPAGSRVRGGVLWIWVHYDHAGSLPSYGSIGEYALTLPFPSPPTPGAPERPRLMISFLES
jgi:hypothetical protein